MTEENTLPEYGEYKEVPPDISYPSAWRQRGYVVRDGEKPIARLKFHLGDKFFDWPLYGLSQCKRLKGKKARRRRQAYISALYGED